MPVSQNHLATPCHGGANPTHPPTVSHLLLRQLEDEQYRNGSHQSSVGCFTHPTPQINITSWSLWDYQFPVSSYTHSLVVSGSSVVPTVVLTTNPHPAGDRMQRGKVYERHPLMSAHRSPPLVLAWEKLWKNEALQQLLAITLHLQMMETVGWRF